MPEDKKADDKQNSKVQQLDIKVYYPDDQGMKLVAVKRQIKFDGKTDKYTAAMNSLLQGTKEKGKATIIPKQAKLNKVTFADGTVTVDFDNGLVKHFIGGSTGEEMLVGSIVNTLTEFPEVKRVKIIIDGKSVETIAGHMDLASPIARMQELVK